MKAKSKYAIGERAWLVGGWEHPPLNEYGESDWDRATEHAYICKTKEQAIELAKKLAPKMAHGYCSIKEVRRGYDNEWDEEDGLASWIPCGEEIEIEVEEETP